MIIGNKNTGMMWKKYLENNAMMIGIIKIGHFEKEKYLGDIIHNKTKSLQMR